MASYGYGSFTTGRRRWNPRPPAHSVGRVSGYGGHIPGFQETRAVNTAEYADWRHMVDHAAQTERLGKSMRGLRSVDFRRTRDNTPHIRAGIHRPSTGYLPTARPERAGAHVPAPPAQPRRAVSAHGRTRDVEPEPVHEQEPEHHEDHRQYAPSPHDEDVDFTADFGERGRAMGYGGHTTNAQSSFGVGRSTFVGKEWEQQRDMYPTPDDVIQSMPRTHHLYHSGRQTMHRGLRTAHAVHAHEHAIPAGYAGHIPGAHFTAGV